MTAERRRLLLLFACGIALYFFTNLQRTGVPGSLFNELQRDLALSAAQVAMLGTFFVYVYTFNQLVAGVLADRYGGTRTMLFGSFFFCIGSLLFPLADSLWTAYAARALVGFGASFMYLSMVKLAQRLFPNIFPQMVGMLLLLGYLGSITANAPLMSLAGAVGWRSALLAAGSTTAVLLGFFILLRQSVPLPPVRDIPFSFRPFREFARVRHNRYICIFSGSNFAFYFVLQVIIGKKFLEDYCSLSGNAAALAMSAMALVAASSGMLAALISRLIGNRRRIFIRVSCVYGVAAMALILVCVLLEVHSPLLAVPILLFGFTGNIGPITVALLSETNPPERTGIAVSASNFAAYLGVSISGSCAGVLMDVAAPERVGDVLVYGRWSYAAVFAFFLLTAAVCAPFSFRIRETFGKNIRDRID